MSEPKCLSPSGIAYRNNPELCRMRGAVSYYRKLRNEGKEWKPKPSSKLYLYCLARGLDSCSVILGEQQLECYKALPSVCRIPEIEKMQAFLKYFREKYHEVINNPPWLPDKDHEFAKWCRENSINIGELIEGRETIDTILDKNNKES